MYEIHETAAFAEWLGKLKDGRAKAKIVVRVQRMTNGNFGDVAPVGGSVSELRIHYGPGYRVYFVRRGRKLIILLCGGDKSSQRRDIALARQMEEEL